jgi:hypothetical protein
MSETAASHDHPTPSFVDASMRGARFVRSDLSGTVMRGVDVAGADIDSPWLLEDGGSLLVNGVDVVPFVRAELARRGPTSVVAVGEGSVVERLSEILTDAPARHRSSARHVTLGTPHSELYGRLAAEMLADVELSDLDARTDPELTAAMGRLVGMDLVQIPGLQAAWMLPDRGVLRRWLPGWSQMA